MRSEPGTSQRLMDRNAFSRLVLSIVVAAVLVAHAKAQAAAPQPSLRLVPVQVKRTATIYAVYKQAENGRVLETAALQRMGNVIEDYGAFVTLEASSRQIAELKRQAVRVERYELGKLKKIQGVPLELARAPSGVTREQLGRTAGFYIVQFTSFPKEEWFAALALDGAKKNPSGFFSDFGHLYWLGEGQARQILQHYLAVARSVVLRPCYS